MQQIAHGRHPETAQQEAHAQPHHLDASDWHSLGQDASRRGVGFGVDAQTGVHQDGEDGVHGADVVQHVAVLQHQAGHVTRKFSRHIIWQNLHAHQAPCEHSVKRFASDMILFQQQHVIMTIIPSCCVRQNASSYNAWPASSLVQFPVLTIHKELVCQANDRNLRVQTLM